MGPTGSRRYAIRHQHRIRRDRIQDTIRWRRGTRSLVISKLANGAVIALPSEERGVQLFAFAHCTFYTPLGVNGRPYYFVQGDRSGPGSGTGVGCIARHLVGYEVTTHGQTTTITATQVNVTTDGRTATNGPTTTTARNVPATSPEVQSAGSATCAAAPVLLPTFGR